MSVFTHWNNNNVGNTLKLCLLVILLCVNGTQPHIANVEHFYSEKTLQWENVQMEFLTNVHHAGGLHTQDYHIAHLIFPQTQKKFIMHVTRSQGLFHPQHLDMTGEEAEHLRCVYSGTVREVSDDHSSQHGQVSLSSCHHETGFEGLVLLPDNQFYIRPSSPNPVTGGLRWKRSSQDSAVPYKAFKINSANPLSHGQSIDEVLIPSPEDLAGAPQTNFDMLEDEPHETDATPLDAENEIDDSLSQIENTWDFESDNSVPVSPLRASHPNGHRKPAKMARNKARQQQQQPKKMAASVGTGVVRVVEIAVFTDAKLFEVWKTLYPKDTLAKMNQYVLAVINNMNALYKQPTMPENLTFRLVHLEVQTTKSKTMNHHNGHASNYLKSFCAYSAEKNHHGTMWDHALLLTGHDLNEKGSNATAGLAWFSTMCVHGYSCSVIEGMTFGSTFITSHEIGHGLGMDHDGTGRNAGCDGNSYIMSPTTGGGKTDWSACSVKNMRDFLTKGYNGYPAPKCITKKGSKSGNPIKFSGNQLPGQQFNAKEQCLAQCKGCTPYIKATKPYNDICHVLHCEQKASQFYSYVLTTHPALEGTTCASGKVCRFGHCK